MRRRWFVVVVLTAASSVGATALFMASSNAEVTKPAAVPKSVTLGTRTIASTQKFDGALQFEGSTPVSVESPGIVTKTRSAGEVIEQGGALVWVDNQPVTLLYGELPQWRNFQPGMSDGPDVRQLEQSLVDLGYAKGLGLTVDNAFTTTTQTAVKRMQDALGTTEDGVVDRGEIVFLSGARRVTAVTAKPGSPVGQSIVEVSSTKRVVKVDLSLADRSDLSFGQAVAVKLPDGAKVDAVVRAVGTEVETSPDGEKSVEVLIDLAAEVRFDDAPVEVEVRTELATNVLAAPVNALLAQSGGGYGVERLIAGRSEIVPVEIGAVGNGYVEVRGNLQPGDTVVVAS
jgi:peptidoglycan hydrolase-like protein with peptidoglycan-binding domain